MSDILPHLVGMTKDKIKLFFYITFCKILSSRESIYICTFVPEIFQKKYLRPLITSLPGIVPLLLRTTFFLLVLCIAGLLLGWMSQPSASVSCWHCIFLNTSSTTFQASRLGWVHRPYFLSISFAYSKALVISYCCTDSDDDAYNLVHILYDGIEDTWNDEHPLIRRVYIVTTMALNNLALRFCNNKDINN